MGRPIIKRTLIAYERDIAALRRLRVAITMDKTFDYRRVAIAVRDIDKCIESLLTLKESIEICA